MRADWIKPMITADRLSRLGLTQNHSIDVPQKSGSFDRGFSVWAVRPPMNRSNLYIAVRVAVKADPSEFNQRFPSAFCDTQRELKIHFQSIGQKSTN